MFFFIVFVMVLRSCLKVLGDHSGKVYLKCPHWPKLLPTFCILVEKFIFPGLLTGNKRKASLSQVTLRLWLQMDLIVCILALKEIGLIQQEVFLMESHWFLPALDVLLCAYKVDQFWESRKSISFGVYPFFLCLFF